MHAFSHGAFRAVIHAVVYIIKLSGVVQYVQRGTITSYLLGYKISLPEVFWYPNFPKQNNLIKTTKIGYQKTSGKPILQANNYIRVAH